jgi:hypothetical protein
MKHIVNTKQNRYLARILGERRGEGVLVLNRVSWLARRSACSCITYWCPHIPPDIGIGSVSNGCCGKWMLVFMADIGLVMLAMGIGGVGGHWCW